MGKSIRASSHIHAKSIKRHNVFQKVVDARAERLSEKLKKDLIDQKMKELEKKSSNGQMDIETKAVEELDQSKSGSGKKVSTSGWRNARHHDYKKAKKMKKPKKNAFTKF